METKAKSKYKLRSRYNFVLTKEDMETSTMKSLTVPDETYTVKEILEKSKNGLIPSLSGKAFYMENEMDHEDDDLDKFNRSDMQEKAEILERARETVNTWERAESLKKAAADKVKKAREEEQLAKKIIENYEKSKGDNKKSVPDAH